MVTLGQSDVTMGEVHVAIPKHATDSIEAIADAVTGIRQVVGVTDLSTIEMKLNDISCSIKSLALKDFKFEPYIHVSQPAPILPDIKFPDVHNKNDVVINLPRGFVAISFFLQVFTILSVYGILRFFPR